MYEELSHALIRMKNNKSAGSDGFSVEFLKYFGKICYFVGILIMLFLAVNYP